MSLKTRLTPLGGPVPVTMVPTLCTGNGCGSVAFSTQSNEQYQGSAVMTETEFGGHHGGSASNQNTFSLTLDKPVKSDDGNWAINMRFASQGGGYTEWFRLIATYIDGTTEEWVSVSNVVYYNATAKFSFYTKKAVKALALVSYAHNLQTEYYNASEFAAVFYTRRVIGR